MVRPMPRLWLYTGLLCLACAGEGCAHRDIEGLWEGPLPPIAGDRACRVRLLKGGVFDFRCERPRLVDGAGHYGLQGDELVLRFERMREEGRPVRSEGLILTYRVSGSGNRIELAPKGGGKPILWSRAPL
jgi:hypothetical protein